MQNSTSTIHILNGDSLKERFPAQLSGKLLVARECLVDGEVHGNSFEELMATRAKFIDQYPQCTASDYMQNTVPEFEQMSELPMDADICCWFEEDLFCQVNFWFVCSLLEKQSLKQVFLVRPNPGNEYSFGHMSDAELITAFEQKYRLDQQALSAFSELWSSYQARDNQALLSLANALSAEFPFVVPAVKAQLAREPDECGLGYPERVLLAIMREQSDNSFPVVFRDFYHKMAIYSFGDLQVKAMYDRLLPLL